MLQAVRRLSQLRGREPVEIMAWLRQILARQLANTFRYFYGRKRNLAKERSLQAALAESSMLIEAGLAAKQSSPSQHAERLERVLRLTEALDRLPDSQRQAVIQHHLGGQTLAEVSQTLGRSPDAVAGLIIRGLRGLRDHLKECNAV